MRYCSEKIIWLPVLAILLLAGSANAATQISSCTTISLPGEYVLNQSIINSGSSSCINITSSNVTFDGAGYAIDGVDAPNTYGVYGYNSTTTLINVTIKNLNLTDWYYGINGLNVVNGNITNNTVISNSRGIFLYNSRIITLINNTANSNSGDGISLSLSGTMILNNNIANSNSYGISLYSSNVNILTNNTANSNYNGIYLSDSNTNTLTNNNAKENDNYDVYVSASSSGYCNNTIENIAVSGDRPLKYFNTSVNLQNEILSELILCNADNSMINNVTIEGSVTKQNNGVLVVITDNSNFLNVNSSNNYIGIFLSRSNNNILINSTVNSNRHYGIHLPYSGNNTLTKNVVNSNNGYGIFLSYSGNNTIYNNRFNNTQNFYLSSSTNIWNTTKTLGTNIIGGVYLGGNFWAYPNGTGFGQTCTDADNDGICDSAYSLASGNIDYLPLSLNFTTITSPVSSVGYSALVATGQNTYVHSSNGTFGLLLKGQTKTINNSVVLNNTGDISARAEARFNDSRGGVFGLVSGANVLNATNFALGIPSALVPLSSLGADVLVAVAPPGATALDARLAVPGDQVAGDYSGTVILTFSNSV